MGCSIPLRERSWSSFLPQGSTIYFGKSMPLWLERTDMCSIFSSGNETFISRRRHEKCNTWYVSVNWREERESHMSTFSLQSRQNVYLSAFEDLKKSKKGIYHWAEISGLLRISFHKHCMLNVFQLRLMPFELTHLQLSGAFLCICQGHSWVTVIVFSNAILMIPVFTQTYTIIFIYVAVHSNC